MNKDSSGGDRAAVAARSVARAGVTASSPVSTSNNASAVHASNDVFISSGSLAANEHKSGAADDAAAAATHAFHNAPNSGPTSHCHDANSCSAHVSNAFPMPTELSTAMRVTGAGSSPPATVGISDLTVPTTSLSHLTTTLTDHATSSMAMSAGSSSSDSSIGAIFPSRSACSTSSSSSSARHEESVRESPVNSGSRAGPINSGSRAGPGGFRSLASEESVRESPVNSDSRARPGGFRSIFAAMVRPSDSRALMVELKKPADINPSHDKKEHRFLIKSLLQQLSAQSVKVLDNCVRCEIKRAVDAKLLVLFVFRSDADCSAALQLFTAAKISAHLAKARMSYLVLERVNRSVSVAEAQQVFVSAGITVAAIVRPSDGSGVVLSKLCVGILSRDVGTFLTSPVLASLSRGIMKVTVSKFSLPRKVCTECWSIGHSRRACACARADVRCPICSEHHLKESCPLKDNPRSSRSRCPLCSHNHPGFDCSMFRGSLSPLLPAEQYAQQRGAAPPVPPPALSDTAAFPPLPNASTPAVQSAPSGWAAAQSHAMAEKVANLEAKVQSMSVTCSTLKTQMQSMSDTCSTLKAQNSELISCVSKLSASMAKLTERFDQVLVQHQEIMPAIHALLSRSHLRPSGGAPPTSPVPSGGHTKGKKSPTPVAPATSKSSTHRSLNISSLSSLHPIAPPSAPTRSQFSSASAAALSSSSNPSDALSVDSLCSE